MECTKIFSLWDSGRKNQLQIIAVREFEACPIFILIPWERIMNTDISKSFYFFKYKLLGDTECYGRDISQSYTESHTEKDRIRGQRTVT